MLHFYHSLERKTGFKWLGNTSNSSRNMIGPDSILGSLYVVCSRYKNIAFQLEILLQLHKESHMQLFLKICLARHYFVKNIFHSIWVNQPYLEYPY